MINRIISIKRVSKKGKFVNRGKAGSLWKEKQGGADRTEW